MRSKISAKRFSLHHPKRILRNSLVKWRSSNKPEQIFIWVFSRLPVIPSQLDKVKKEKQQRHYKMNLLIFFNWLRLDFVLQLQTCGPLFSERVLMMVSLVLVVSLQPLSLLTSFSENGFHNVFSAIILLFLRNVFCVLSNALSTYFFIVIPIS